MKQVPSLQHKTDFNILITDYSNIQIFITDHSKIHSPYNSQLSLKPIPSSAFPLKLSQFMFLGVFNASASSTDGLQIHRAPANRSSTDQASPVVLIICRKFKIYIADFKKNKFASSLRSLLCIDQELNRVISRGSLKHAFH